MGNLLSKAEPDVHNASVFGPAMDRAHLQTAGAKATTITTPGSFDEDPVDYAKDHMSLEPENRAGGALQRGLKRYPTYIQAEWPVFTNRYEHLTLTSNFFERVVGPSVNILVGPNQTQFTLPRNLLYHYSEFAERALEGGFLEAGEKVLRLPEDDPEVFYWLVQWMLQGRLGVFEHFYGYRRLSGNGRELWREYACRTLCRLSILADKLLDERPWAKSWGDESIHVEIKYGLDQLFGDALLSDQTTPVTPDIVLEVWENTAAHIQGPGALLRGPNLSLRQTLFHELCTSVFSKEVNCSKYTECFRLDDGKFAASAMGYLMRRHNSWR